jgi:ABC-type polar amino acid transport system ATPase subunit
MIEIKNVSKWYGPVQVLNDCSVSIAKGDVVVVCGPSGSGKSTLIKTVNGLEPIQKGEISVNGISLYDPKTDLPKLRSHVGMVFQQFRAVSAPVGDGKPDDRADQGAGAALPTKPRSAASRCSTAWA